MPVQNNQAPVQTPETPRKLKTYRRMKVLHPQKVFRQADQVGQAVGDVTTRGALCAGAGVAGFGVGFFKGAWEAVVGAPEEPEAVASAAPHEIPTDVHVG